MVGVFAAGNKGYELLSTKEEWMSKMPSPEEATSSSA